MVLDGGGEGVESLPTLLTDLSSSTTRRAGLTALLRVCRDGKGEVLVSEFRSILRMLVESLGDSAGSVRALVYGALGEMMQQQAIAPLFSNFTELVILKVLDGHKDTDKDVSIWDHKTLIAHIVVSELKPQENKSSAVPSLVTPLTGCKLMNISSIVDVT